MVQDLLGRITALHARLRSRSTVNVNDKKTKSEAIDLATSYFEKYRAQFAAIVGDTRELQAQDGKWQGLVRLAQGNNQRKTYLSLLAGLTRDLKELGVLVMVRAAERTNAGQGPSDLTPAEQQLLSTLESLLPTAAASYRQGILDLRSRERLSYRGTASEFREALRETLDHLAPDDDVMSQPGYKLENGQKAPTMKQKARFILMSRGRNKTQREPTEKAIGVIEALTGEVVRATYSSASLATHLESTRAEVLRVKRYVDTVLFDLLEVES